MHCRDACAPGRSRYGINVDTGGHIRYLLGLVEASYNAGDLDRIVVATRAFESEFGENYLRPQEWISNKIELVRFRTSYPGYLAKEELWQEVPSYAQALSSWIEAQPKRPDIIHAHYADAGVVARIVRKTLGIPYVFIAHSLGRVKLKAFADSADMEHPHSQSAIDNRIRAEEQAIEAASLVIASSRDEAENQYADYKAYDPGRIRIIPPGAELLIFRSAMPNLEADRMINRFLTDPDKPPLLAIARPVLKKNSRRPRQSLWRVARASGTSQSHHRRRQPDGLQRPGAGKRCDHRGNSSPHRHVRSLRQGLLSEDPSAGGHSAIYCYAWSRRGVFVNPALNEPFGLTLLEAAAVGLPIIATDSGGPNDIVEVCRNGELVDPNAPEEIAESALRILSDEALWRAYSEKGFRAVRRFNWRAHAKRYHRLLDAVVQRAGRAQPEHRELLVCDIDGTLLGSRTALQRVQRVVCGPGGPRARRRKRPQPP